MIAMIDMNMGNLKSVVEAFKRVGAVVEVTNKAEDLERADAVILPGVGAFGDGMASLQKNRLVEPLHHFVLERRKPLLGLCLGMQLLAQEGEEHGLYKGIGLIDGRVVRLKPSQAGYRVPNMGWCDLKVIKHSRLFRSVQDGESFYFAHSYYLDCFDPGQVAAVIEYSGSRLAAAIEQGNIFGVQFHPEKSQDMGLNILESFARYVAESKSSVVL